VPSRQVDACAPRCILVPPRIGSEREFS
jgi:hypothetical protein